MKCVSDLLFSAFKCVALRGGDERATIPYKQVRRGEREETNEVEQHIGKRK